MSLPGRDLQPQDGWRRASFAVNRQSGMIAAGRET